MVVDDAARLHAGPERRRADEAEAGGLQALRQRLRLGRLRVPVGGRLRRADSSPARATRRARAAACLPRAARARRARSRSPLRSCRDAARCPRRRAAASTSCSPNARDRVGVEAGEGAAEVLALAQDRDPREARLEALETEALVHPLLRRDRPSPLLVVVRDVERVGRPTSSGGRARQPTSTRTMPSTICTG